MIEPERYASFVEYVLRPISEDWRLIFEKLKELNLPLSEGLIKRSIFTLGIFHLLGECIRTICYIVIVFIVCKTAIAISR